MEVKEATTLAAQLRAQGDGIEYRAEVRGTGRAARIYFRGARSGDHSIDVGASDRARVLGNWEGYIEPIKRADISTLAKKIPAISVRQPWAEMIARGEKRIECGRDVWAHRGWTVIHASKARADREDLADCRFSVREANGLPYGAVIALVWLAESRLPKKSDALLALCDPGEKPVLVFDNRKRLIPKPFRGHPGLFYVPLDLVIPA